MSLTGEITNLIGRADDLISTFEAKKGDIEQAVQEAVAAVPEMGKSFWVDQLTGDDDDNGTQAAPLRSISEAVSRTPVGGVCFVRLLSAYHFTENVRVGHKSLYVIGDYADLKPVSFGAYQKEANGKAYRALYGIDFEGNAKVDFYGVKLQVPNVDGAMAALDTINFSSPIRTMNTAGLGVHTLVLRWSELNIPANHFAQLFHPQGGGALLMAVVTEAGEPALGRLINGADNLSGTDPSTMANVITNLSLV